MQIFLFVLALLLHIVFSVVSLAVVEKRINNQIPKSWYSWLYFLDKKEKTHLIEVGGIGLVLL